MTEASLMVLKEAGLGPEDVDLVIPHQANQRILDDLIERLGVHASKLYSNIERVGNTASASIPIALDECVRAGRIKQGDLLLLTAFGGGATWGAAILKW
jgi:3-oxoacyl-[acyl-carrier-protein] synthase-3